MFKSLLAPGRSVPQISGLLDRGASCAMRHILTAFGSGWQGNFESRTIMDAPAKFLKIAGSSESSIRATDIQHNRYSSPQQLEELIQAYKKGGNVQPVEIFLDEFKNVIGVEGRHRALAAQKAGIEKFPVVIRKRVSEEAAAVESIMKAGEGAAITKAGTAEVPALLKAGSRMLRNAL